MTRWLAFLCVSLSALTAHAQTRESEEHPFDRLQWPVDCVLGQSCYIQNYVDRAPGSDVRDVACGPLSYDGHKGTDIALPSRAAVANDVEVRAAADGTVRGTRNDMPDVVQGTENAPDVTGRECGNGVAVQQSDGLLALYCHMKRGSVTVSSGQTVKAGDVLGAIGLSGNTMFPHLHFELVKDETPIDPFAPDAGSANCEPYGALWQTQVDYVPGGLLAAGLSVEIPTYTDVKRGLTTSPSMTDPAQLIVWGFGYGARQGDVVVFEIVGPGGIVLEERVTQEKNRAQFYNYFGKRRGETAWAPGLYRTTVSILRDDQILATREAETRID